MKSQIKLIKAKKVGWLIPFRLFPEFFSFPETQNMRAIPEITNGTVIFSIIFSVLLILSCGQINLLTYQKNFRKIEITNSVDSATVIMFIQLSNQKAFDIYTSSITYDLFIDEMPCGHGTLNEPIIIKPNEIKRISLPLWVPYNQLDKVSKSVLQNKLTSPTYKLTGELIIIENDKEKKQEFIITNK